jgi:hypothetical protein
MLIKLVFWLIIFKKLYILLIFILYNEIFIKKKKEKRFLKNPRPSNIGGHRDLPFLPSGKHDQLWWRCRIPGHVTKRESFINHRTPEDINGRRFFSRAERRQR